MAKGCTTFDLRASRSNYGVPIDGIFCISAIDGIDAELVYRRWIFTGDSVQTVHSALARIHHRHVGPFFSFPLRRSESRCTWLSSIRVFRSYFLLGPVYRS